MYRLVAGLIITFILTALNVHTVRSSHAAMISYNSKIQDRYMINQTQSRDVVVFMYIPHYGNVDSCTLTLYSIVLLAYCPLCVRILVVHADEERSAEVAHKSVQALMSMLRQRNMVRSVCRHVEDHTTCIPCSSVSSETINGHYSCGSIVRAGVLMVPQWDKKFQDNVSNATGIYACWPQTVEHTFHHIASASDTEDHWMARAKQYVDLTFDSGIDCDKDTRPLFPQLVYNGGFSKSDLREDLPVSASVHCLGTRNTNCHFHNPEQCVLCSSAMCFGSYNTIIRCCTILSVLCVARVPMTHLDIVLSAYLYKSHGISAYFIPQSLLCRTFDKGQSTDHSDIDQVHAFVYDDEEGSSFLKKHLAIGGEVNDRRQRMMGLMKSSREEIRLKYHSMEGYIAAYRDRLRKDRLRVEQLTTKGDDDNESMGDKVRTSPPI